MEGLIKKLLITLSRRDVPLSVKIDFLRKPAAFPTTPQAIETSCWDSPWESWIPPCSGRETDENACV